MAAGDRHPFGYPDSEHERRHQPPQFQQYRSFKEYLRDEFIFTCVYCLSRETWNMNASFFGVDHYRPKSRFTEGTLNYQNLVYACNECNRAKGGSVLPAELQPEVNPYGRHLRINADGIVDRLSEEGGFLIDLLHLNRADRIRWRRIHYEIYEEALRKQGQAKARQRLRDLFGFPPNAPKFRRQGGAVNPYARRSHLPEWF